jgi:iron complex outermembrane recepter protein
LPAEIIKPVGGNLLKIHITNTARAEHATWALRPVAAACTIAFMAGAMPAFAQTPAPAQVETITITGIRKGIEDAISVKKNSDSIVEAISAEDIGKLPDTTVAESISRLPGVAAQRNKSTGKLSAVSVRGLSPDFNGTLLNGREQATTGEARGAELDQYPAELLGQVLVYKTPDALLVGQGLASTIDQRTIRPLDFGKRTIAGSYKHVQTAIGAGEGANEGKGSRYSVSYVDQFADRTVGIALGFTRLDEKGGEQQKINTWGGCCGDDVPYNGQKVKTPGGFTSDTEQLNQKRDGVLGVIQFKPNKNFEAVLDVFHSKGDTALKKTGLEGAIRGSTGGYDPDGVLSNATIATIGGNLIATSGTFNNYNGVVRNHLESGEDKLTSIGLNLKGRFGDWLATGDVSQSKAEKANIRFETTSGIPGNSNKTGISKGNISWTGFNGSNNADVKYSTSVNYADRNVVKLTDINGWSGGEDSPQAGYVATPTIKDELNNIRISAGRDVSFGPITRAEFGVNFTDREKAKSTEEGRLIIKGTDPYGAATVPGSAVGTAGVTGIQVVSFDPRGSVGTIFDLPAKVDKDILNKSWAVTEKITTFFVKGDLDGAVGSVNYRGNVGIQVVGSKQNATGVNINQALCTGNTPATCPSTTVTGGKSYTDVLPSLNVNFDVGNDQIVRFGLGQAMSRANMGDMRATINYNFDNTKQIFTGDGGNPELDPFRAKAIDLSYEKYFGKKGYISAAAFYKDLDSYILKVGRPFDFKPYIGSGNVPKGASTIGLLTTPVNGSAGTISGFELAVNMPFSLLHSSLDGFGVLINHSDTSSSISLASAGLNTQDIGLKSIPLPGLSKRVTNARIYFEKYGFQVALAARQRSDFLGEISDFQDNRQYTFVKAETTADAQVSYEFGSGMFKGLGVTFQAGNLTNAKFERYNPENGNIVESIKYGKSYTFGINYKL